PHPVVLRVRLCDRLDRLPQDRIREVALLTHLLDLLQQHTSFQHPDLTSGNELMTIQIPIDCTGDRRPPHLPRTPLNAVRSPSPAPAPARTPRSASPPRSGPRDSRSRSGSACTGSAPRSTRSPP